MHRLLTRGIYATSIIILWGICLLLFLLILISLDHPRDQSLLTEYNEKFFTVREGMVQTQFSVEKPEGTYRILLFGGSAAMGYPYVQGYQHTSYLQSFLPEEGGIATYIAWYLQQSLPHLDIEVKNLALAGYPSAFVLRDIQATVPLVEADLYLVMTGNNEGVTFGRPATPALLEQATREFRQNLLTIEKTLQGTPHYFITLPRNLPVSTFADLYEDHCEAAKEEGLPEPVWHYQKGRCHQSTGDLVAAYRHLRESQDQSPNFLGVRSQWNELIRSMPDHIDLDELFFARAPLGGEGLFHDMSHLSIEGNRIAGKAIAGRILQDQFNGTALIETAPPEITYEKLGVLYLIKMLKWTRMHYYGVTGADEIAEEYRSDLLSLFAKEEKPPA